jgi:hypothetical protein
VFYKSIIPPFCPHFVCDGKMMPLENQSGHLYLSIMHVSEHVHIHRPKLNQHLALRTLNGLLPVANLCRLCTFLQQVYFGQISGAQIFLSISLVVMGEL